VTPQAESIPDLFRTTGAYLNGHFRLTSGLHSPEYLQCALVLQYPRHAAELGGLLADELRKLVHEPVGLVVSPALGGLIIGHEVARALGARFIFTERDENKKMILRRGFTVSPGEAALVVDLVAVGQATTNLAALARVADLDGAPLTAMVLPRLEVAVDLEERVPAAAQAEARVRQMRLAQFPMMQVPTAPGEMVPPA